MRAQAFAGPGHVDDSSGPFDAVVRTPQFFLELTHSVQHHVPQGNAGNVAAEMSPELLELR